MHLWSIVLAAGQGTRLGHLPEKKQFLAWRERPLFWHSVRTLGHIPGMQGVLVVFAPEECGQWDRECAALKARDTLGPELRAVAGGASRQESSLAGIEALPGTCDAVLIHDAARPFVSPRLVQGVVDKLAQGCEAVVPGVPITDTVKRLGPDGLQTLPRDGLYAAQTPQGFARETIEAAHREARRRGIWATDDAALVEILPKTVTLAPGEEGNIKITNPKDLEDLRLSPQKAPKAVAGWGYDVHRLGRGRPMKLGGVPITNGPRVDAHSDGDVLLHAVIDSLLGCLGQGDIGDHFPDSEPRFENVSSGVLLAEVLDLAQREGLVLDHLDATLICQQPKLGPWKAPIKNALAGLLGMPPARISLKATTEEGLGFTGTGQGIKAVALLTAHLDD